MPGAGEDRLQHPGRSQNFEDALRVHRISVVPQGVQLAAAMATGYRYVFLLCQNEVVLFYKIRIVTHKHNPESGIVFSWAALTLKELMSPDVSVCDCCLLFALTGVSYTDTQLLWVSPNYSLSLSLTHFHDSDELKSMLCGTFTCEMLTKRVKYVTRISHEVWNTVVCLINRIGMHIRLKIELSWALRKKKTKKLLNLFSCIQR